MANRIKNISILAGVGPDLAELVISLYPERLTSVTQVRGRFVGPRCPYATTVEIAYPLREQSREYQTTASGSPHLYLRVIIPEPNIWEPETPFVYQAILELWEGKEKADTLQITYGLKVIEFNSRGLRVNGRPLLLRGVCQTEYSEAEIRSLHQAGYNTLVVPAGPDTTRWCGLAERFGFLVLVHIKDKADKKFRDLRKANATSRDFRTDYPSPLGWLVCADLLQDELGNMVLVAVYSPMGIELTRVPEKIPSGTAFLACEESHLPSLEGIRLPKLVMRKGPARTDLPVASRPEGRDILGWIEEPTVDR
jgi:hypothetical protein